MSFIFDWSSLSIFYSYCFDSYALSGVLLAILALHNSGVLMLPGIERGNNKPYGKLGVFIVILHSFLTVFCLFLLFYRANYLGFDVFFSKERSIELLFFLVFLLSFLCLSLFKESCCVDYYLKKDRVYVAWYGFNVLLAAAAMVLGLLYIVSMGVLNIEGVFIFAVSLLIGFNLVFWVSFNKAKMSNELT